MEAKRESGCKKARFTRKHSAFQSLIEDEVHGSMLEGAYENMREVYEAIDKAHKCYSSLVDKATFVIEGDYLGESLRLYSEA